MGAAGGPPPPPPPAGALFVWCLSVSWWQRPWRVFVGGAAPSTGCPVWVHGYQRTDDAQAHLVVPVWAAEGGVVQRHGPANAACPAHKATFGPVFGTPLRGLHPEFLTLFGAFRKRTLCTICCTVLWVERPSGTRSIRRVKPPPPNALQPRRPLSPPFPGATVHVFPSLLHTRLCLLWPLTPDQKNPPQRLAAPCRQPLCVRLNPVPTPLPEDHCVF